MNTLPIVVAIDTPDLAAIQQLLSQLDPTLCRVKVGITLFTQFGPSLLEMIRKAGFEIFLDLKFHDIPAQVAGACRVAADLDVWMLTLHCSGGERMLAAAREAVANTSSAPILVGVTVLTSLADEELKAIGWQDSSQVQVQRLATVAMQAGLDGIVCSGHEAANLRQVLGDDAVLVTPGIRLQQDPNDDQRRIMTPRQALDAGSSYLVIGRPITKAADPAAALAEIAAQIQ